MRDLQETPDRAVQDGRIRYGLFRSPFSCLNLTDADIFQKGDSRLRGLGNFRLKEWEHFGIFAGPYFLGVALVDLKFAGVSWCSLFHRPSGTLHEQERKFLPGRIRIPPELRNGSMDLKAGGGYRILLENRLEEGYHRLVVKVKAGKSFPGVLADLILWERPEQVQPLIALLPLGENRPFFSHKAPCFVEGEVTVGTESFAVKQNESVALLDFHRAFYPHKTYWEWATFAGFDRQGDLIGMNLTRNVIERDDLYNENGVWYRNTLHPVGPAEFRIPERKGDPWHVRSRDGHVDLTFRPLGGRSETIRLGPFHASYDQPLGLFSGKLCDSAGVVHVVEDMIGMVEDHRVTW
jgi:hypothetical protein